MSPVFTPADFVAAFNQTLELAYPLVIIEGELANFKVCRNTWVYFDVKDELASIKFFGSVFKLPGPLQDGLRVRVIGQPKLHPQFGFSITFSTVLPVGEGSIKKAADLLRTKLATVQSHIARLEVVRAGYDAARIAAAPKEI